MYQQIATRCSVHSTGNNIQEAPLDDQAVSHITQISRCQVSVIRRIGSEPTVLFLTAKKLPSLHFTECRVFLFDQSLLIAEDETARSLNSFSSHFGRVVRGSGSQAYRSAARGLGGTLSPPISSTVLNETPASPFAFLPNDGRAPQNVAHRPSTLRRHATSTLDGSGANFPLRPRLSFSNGDPFRQSFYRFMYAVKVNNMAFMVSILVNNF